jgi:hypothetical protein
MLFMPLCKKDKLENNQYICLFKKQINNHS